MVIDHSVIVDVFGTRRRVRAQRRDRVLAQRRALPVPALGPGRLRRLQGGAAGHRHRAPGQHRVPGQRRDGPRRGGLPRHLRRHRQPHHDGQRPRRARLGRRRHRGRGRHARPARVDAHPPRRRLQALRRDQAGRHRHRRGAHRHRDAAQARRGRQVRRVLRRGRGRGAAGQPRHAGQHEPRIRFHRSHFPDRRGDGRLPAADRPQADEQLALVEAYAKEQGMWHDPEAGAGRSPSTSNSTWPTWCRRSPGPKRPQDRILLSEAKTAFRKDIPDYVGRRPRQGDVQARRGRRRDVPGQRPGSLANGHADDEPASAVRRPPTTPNGRAEQPGAV